MKRVTMSLLAAWCAVAGVAAAASAGEEADLKKLVDKMMADVARMEAKQRDELEARAKANGISVREQVQRDCANGCGNYGSTMSIKPNIPGAPDKLE